MYTTLNKIRAQEPCKDSWFKLLSSLGKTSADDEPLSLEYILDALGIKDAIWALRAVDGIEREARLFACDCAESVLHVFESSHPNDMRPRRAIEVSRSYANGEATAEEMAAARAAAWAAAGDAAWATEEEIAAAVADEMDAAWASAWAAAWAAAWDAAWDAARAADRARRVGADREKQAHLFRAYFCTTNTQP